MLLATDSTFFCGEKSILVLISLTICSSCSIRFICISLFLLKYVTTRFKCSAALFAQCFSNSSLFPLKEHPAKECIHGSSTSIQSLFICNPNSSLFILFPQCMHEIIAFGHSFMCLLILLLKNLLPHHWHFGLHTFA
eukprot:TRINITY_DN64972_c0_g1_i1.p2 TRINITY_DN64972_c0_g1~~TRINITY_DN64972_c0_g1_i1.p2  ORF type:complete len:137 (-),score=0.51 TRINITY_DN64972_c0_g1_i1:784-1194(-)